jgi:hypothetical protein
MFVGMLYSVGSKNRAKTHTLPDLRMRAVEKIQTYARLREAEVKTQRSFYNG